MMPITLLEVSSVSKTFVHVSPILMFFCDMVCVSADLVMKICWPTTFKVLHLSIHFTYGAFSIYCIRFYLASDSRLILLWKYVGRPLSKSFIWASTVPMARSVLIVSDSIWPVTIVWIEDHRRACIRYKICNRQHPTNAQSQNRRNSLKM